MKAHRPLALLAVAATAAAIGCPRENPEYAELFDLVCGTVSERLGGLGLVPADWPAIQQGCRRAAVTADDDDAFYSALNCALFELELSHLGVVPSRDDWADIEPEVFSPGTVGLTVRKVGRDAVITAVAGGSPADLAGLRPGWVLEDIDGTSVGQIEARLRCCSAPPFYPPSGIAAAIATRLHGEPGSTVAMGVADERGASRRVTLTRAARGAPVTYAPDLPPCFEEFETRLVEGGVRTVRFNTFMPGNAERFEQALLETGPASGLVIDLRDNPGGHRLVCENLASLLVSEPVLFVKVETRDGVRDIVVEPAEVAFTGPVAIVVDATSRSASEVFAAGLQAIGRATIVGERTAGSVGPADTIALPNGATLVCPSGVTTSPRGDRIEGRGVIPDVTITVDRRSLLEGLDPALDAAVRLVREQEGAR